MRTSSRGVLSQLVVVSTAMAALLSCTTSNRSSAGGDKGHAVTGPSRKTQQEVQAELMAFADRYFASTLDAAKIVESLSPTPEVRYAAAAGRMTALVATTDIAASPNPGAALLDMTVFVTLRRMVWEDYWMAQVFGEEGAPVVELLRELENDIWHMAAEVYSPEQLDELRELIDDWRSQHPDARSVDFVRLSELGEARQVQTLVDASQPGGMLAPIREANQEFEEMRLLAERLAFLVTRMQIVVSLQVELALAKAAVQPEIRQLLEDSRTFAGVSDRFAETFATLVADFPEERRAAIEQIFNGLAEEREHIMKELTAEDGGVRPTLGDFRETFESGRQLADKVNEAVISMDRMMERILEEESARPFDIMDYKATIEEATITVQELQTALASVERIMGTDITDEELATLLEGANRLEDEVVDDIIDRTFLRGVALIIVFFVVLTLYRLLIRRFAPDLAWKQKADQ